MRRRDRILRFTVALLRLLLVLNIIFAIAFLAATILSLPLHDQLAARIVAKYPTIDVERVVGGIRALLSLGVVAAIPAHVIFSRLAAVIGTVRIGETFASTNARRVRQVGWALLAIQLLDFPLMLVVRRFDGLGVDSAGSSTSIGGWLSVLVAFVLARVFAEGAALREDLEGTV
jgi:cation transport ATPase